MLHRRRLTLLASLIALFVAVRAVPRAGAGAPLGAVRVVIDPGHGGSDSGAVGNGLLEKDLNLSVALRLRDLLAADTADPSGGGEWDVLLTRTSDVAVSLQARVDLANNWPAERFVSIHHNGFSNSAANGTETFSFASGTVASILRDETQEELLDALGLTDRGSKTANFFVLRETSMPAILSEAGFVSNPGDALVIGSAAGQQASAEAHLFALQRHYGYAPYLPYLPPSTYCTAKVNSAGCLPEIGVDQPPSLGGNATIHCNNVVSERFGLLVWALQPGSVQFGGGLLCVAGTLHRTGVTASNGIGGNNCSGRLEYVVTPAFLQANGLTAGTAVYTQWWYRDPALPQDPIGLSNGLEFIVRP